MIIERELDCRYIKIDTEAKTMTSGVRIRDVDLIIRMNEVKFANLRMLSESFRDEIGLGPALQILTDANVPADSPLWELGRKGVPRWDLLVTSSTSSLTTCGAMVSICFQPTLTTSTSFG